jgi:hypothetical protein
MFPVSALVLGNLPLNSAALLPDFQGYFLHGSGGGGAPPIFHGSGGGGAPPMDAVSVASECAATAVFRPIAATKTNMASPNTSLRDIVPPV